MAWFNLHCHSQFSQLDGMSKVPELVDRAVELGYPGLGLSDHGNMAGVTQLYLGCKKNGITPYPGEEFYLLDPTFEGLLTDKDAAKADRFHLGIYARTTKGYLGLVKLSSLSHTRPRFSRFPRITLDDLRTFGQAYGNDVVLTTGCYFGWLVQSYLEDPDLAVGVLETLKSFAFSDIFVELQHHNVQDETHDDDKLVADLVDLADSCDLPIIATADNHYTVQKQKSAHALMKRMVYGGSDDEFPGDSFHLPSADWVAEHYEPEVWAKVEESCDYLIDTNYLSIEPLDNYRPRVPKVSKTPDGDLRKLVRKGLIDKNLLDSKDHTDRADYELKIIADLGMADYFLHYRQIIDFCEDEGIVKEARGSSNASLVCYVLGITSLDPIKFKLTFERFMSPDRKKPPDIDLDVEDTRKADVVDFLRQDYDVVQIGTWGLLGAHDDGTGSALVSYMTYRAKQTTNETARRNVYARYRARGLSAVREDYPDDYIGLKQISDMNSVYRSYGVHPAGLLLNTDDFQVRDWIPTMLVASSDTVVTQYNMDDLEAWGVLKDDILGQTVLRVMHRTQEIAGRKDPTDFSWMPEEHIGAMRHCRTGRTDTGIFHVEAWTKSKGAKELGVRCVGDLIIMQALYMPGAMSSGAKDDYLERRNTMRPKKIKYIHPIWEDVLGETYGVVIFQEQVIEIMRKLGMSIETINLLFKVVKDSGRGAADRNEKRMATIREEFDQHCTDIGITDLDTAWLSLVGMIEYGFNRAHATGYGIRSYRTAYLKARYTTEFMTALLEAQSGKDAKKEQAYISEARRLKIRLLPVDLNVSGVTWTKAGATSIRRGFLNIHGVGYATAEEIVAHQPFSSIDDLARRVTKKAVSGGAAWLKNRVLGGRMKDLSDAGVFTGLPPGDEEEVE